MIERARGRPVYLNYHVQGINCPKIIRGGKPSDYEPNHYYLETPEQLIKKTRAATFEKNSLVCVDEAYAWGLDARETMTGEKDSRKGRLALTHAILQSRKAHFQIMHTEQLIRSIDNRLRFLTEIYVLMRATAFRIIDGEKTNVEFALYPFQNLGVWGFKQLPTNRISEKVFWKFNKYYDTYEQITLQEQELEKQENIELPKEFKKEFTVPSVNGDEKEKWITALTQDMNNPKN